MSRARAPPIRSALRTGPHEGLFREDTEHEPDRRMSPAERDPAGEYAKHARYETNTSHAANTTHAKYTTYAKVERERRFLLAGPPPSSAVTAGRRITDRYLTGTRLRLRRDQRLDGGAGDLKLTQKIPTGRPGPVQGLITNTYLSPAEYDLLASLPAAVLAKPRLSVPPLGIDVFDPPLHGLVLAEAEFDTDEEARAFRPPEDAVAE